MIKKEDLKIGDIVYYRDGTKKMIFDNAELQDLLDHLNEDLTHYYKPNNYKNDRYDIVKIKRPTSYTKIFERKTDILDEQEKEYLRAVIRPFRKKVKYIVKNNSINYEYLFIRYIDLNNTIHCLPFPDFKKGTMYKNMELNKAYTIEELEL